MNIMIKQFYTFLSAYQGKHTLDALYLFYVSLYPLPSGNH